jgi:hypothetical protein
MANSSESYYRISKRDLDIISLLVDIRQTYMELPSDYVYLLMNSLVYYFYLIVYLLYRSLNRAATSSMRLATTKKRLSPNDLNRYAMYSLSKRIRTY